MKNKVTSLKLSKKLKELGVKQESEFWWVDDILSFPVKPYLSYKNNDNVICSAFLSCELGEMLPDFILEKKAQTYQTDVETEPLEYDTEWGDGMANSMGKMLEYLLEII